MQTIDLGTISIGGEDLGAPKRPEPTQAPRSPFPTREAYKNSETRDFLAQLYGGSIQNMVACMADGGGISPEELEALRAWLKERDPQ